jgi:hypothetical protein
LLIRERSHTNPAADAIRSRSKTRLLSRGRCSGFKKLLHLSLGRRRVSADG